jgi:diaminopimelate decarboxylase
MYDAFHEVVPVTPRSGEPVIYDIVGPVCETGDTFARGRAMAPVLPGDLVAFTGAGAYGAVMSSEYNTRPLVPEVLVRNADWAVVRPRPSYDDMLGRETTPDWLIEP